MPFRMPKLCDSCVYYQGRSDSYSDDEICDAFPDGIPKEIIHMGASHLDGTDIVYKMDLGAEDELGAYVSTWYTADDDGQLAEGIAGIPGVPPEGPPEE